MKSLTVGELIKELSKYPNEIEVKLKIAVDVTMKVGTYKEAKQTVFPTAKVYGVTGTIGNTNEVIISGD